MQQLYLKGNLKKEDAVKRLGKTVKHRNRVIYLIKTTLIHRIQQTGEE